MWVLACFFASWFPLFREMNWSYWSQTCLGVRGHEARTPPYGRRSAVKMPLEYQAAKSAPPNLGFHEGRQVNFLCHFLKTRQLLVPPPRTLHLQSQMAPFMMTTVFQKASLKLSGASKSALCGKFTSLAFLGSCNFGPSLRQIRFRWCLNMFDGYDDECQERSIRNASVRCFSWTGWKQVKDRGGRGDMETCLNNEKGCKISQQVMSVSAFESSFLSQHFIFVIIPKYQPNVIH